MRQFKKHKLLPSAKHSIYSLRHSFKDRLKAAEAPKELVDELMAHAIEKPQYGDRYGLKLKLKYLQAIALMPPLPDLETFRGAPARVRRHRRLRALLRSHAPSVRGSAHRSARPTRSRRRSPRAPAQVALALFRLDDRHVVCRLP